MRRWPASGRREAEADDERAGEVRLTDSTDEVGEQGGAVEAAAESMEGSGGIARNANLQSTVRTLSRSTVSQAQISIRVAGV
jgi:hypothetical protein